MMVKRTPAFMSKLMGPSVLLALTLLVGRLSGLLREAIVASVFGVSAQSDVAVILLSLPDLMVNLLIAGGLSAAFVPQLAKASVQEADILARFVGLVTIVLFGFLGLVLYFSPGLVLAALAPGRVDQTELLSGELLVLVGLALPFAAFSGVLGAYINANGRFFISGLGTFLFNVAVIAALLLGFAQSPLQALSLGVFAGAVLRVLPQLFFLPSRLFRSPVAMPANWQEFLRNFFAGLLAVGATLLGSVILRAAASLLEGGSVSVLNYAQKLVELPVGVVLSAVSIVSLTAISKANAAGGAESASNVTIKHMRIAFALGCLAAIGSIGFAEPVAELAFGYGKMTTTDVNIVAALFRTGAFSIPFAALSLMATNFLYATGRTTTALTITVLALCSLLPMAYFAVKGGSTLYLMVAFSTYQAVLAIAIMFRSGLPVISRTGSQTVALLDVGLIKTLLISAAPLLMATIVHFSFTLHSPLISLSIAGIAFLLGLLWVGHSQARTI